MGMFKHAAPLFARFGDRWSEEDEGTIAGWLRPYVPQGGRLLDLGGGTGALASRMSRVLGCRVTVLDPTPEMLAYLPPDDPDVDGVTGTAEAMPFDANAFDAVMVSDAFHHFRDQDGAAREMQRVVKCDGGVLVLELDPTGFVMRTIVIAEKILGEPGAFHTPDGMCAFFAAHGIDGRCERTKWPGYYFLGTVRP